MMRESEALQTAAAAGARVPVVYFADSEVLVESFCKGTPFDFSRTDWKLSYAEVITEISKVHNRKVSDLAGPDTVADWWDWMCDYLEALWHRLEAQHRARYAEVGLGSPKSLWSMESPVEDDHRSTSLVHSDLHPANVLVSDSGIWLLDWELAMKADPLWDCAVSLHRTRWRTAEQREDAKVMWRDALVQSMRVSNAIEIVDFYARVERWKSVLVDIVRYPQEIQQSALQQQTLIDRAADLEAKLVALAQDGNCILPSPGTTARLLTSWMRHG